jgi:uncharacterized protein (TIGR02466 family)
VTAVKYNSVDGNIVPIFPTLISWTKDLEYLKIKEKFVTACLGEYKKDPVGVKKSNIGGWQSNCNWVESPENIFYKNYIEGRVQNIMDKQFKISKKHLIKFANCWISINKKGNFNDIHTHPQAVFSGVFYVKCPNHNSGEINFINERKHVDYTSIESIDSEITSGYNLASGYWIAPEEGMMIIFPSSIPHSVGVNNTDEDRISISFNVQVQIGG